MAFVGQDHVGVTGKGGRADRTGQRAAARGWIGLLARAPALGVVVDLLSSRLYVVRGDSMTPSLQPGNQLLVSRAAYASSRPSRGDVVIVRGPGNTVARYLKRVVGQPGEEVRILDGALLIDGARMNEPYLGGLPASVGMGDSAWELGPDEYFVLGDNRLRSIDSREYGPVGARLIVGKAWFRYWPLQSWGAIG